MDRTARSRRGVLLAWIALGSSLAIHALALLFAVPTTSAEMLEAAHPPDVIDLDVLPVARAPDVIPPPLPPETSTQREPETSTRRERPSRARRELVPATEETEDEPRADPSEVADAIPDRAPAAPEAPDEPAAPPLVATRRDLVAHGALRGLLARGAAGRGQAGRTGAAYARARMPRTIGGPRCGDPINGVWVALVHSAGDGRWFQLTLRIERAGDELGGEILSHVWTGGVADHRPPACSPDRYDYTVRMDARGSLDGEHVSFGAESFEYVRTDCGGWRAYCPDRFTGTFSARDQRIEAVDHGGCTDFGEPVRFRRTACVEREKPPRL